MVYRPASQNWLESAKLGYAPAQFSVGASYIIGSGVGKDMSEARRWLQLAIDSTNEDYSEVAQTLYNINGLEKYQKKSKFRLMCEGDMPSMDFNEL